MTWIDNFIGVESICCWCGCSCLMRIRDYKLQQYTKPLYKEDCSNAWVLWDLLTLKRNVPVLESEKRKCIMSFSRSIGNKKPSTIKSATYTKNLSIWFSSAKEIMSDGYIPSECKLILYMYYSTNTNDMDVLKKVQHYWNNQSSCMKHGFSRQNRYRPYKLKFETKRLQTRERIHVDWFQKNLILPYNELS